MDAHANNIMVTSDIRDVEIQSMHSELSLQCHQLKEKVAFLGAEQRRYRERERMYQEAITSMSRGLEKLQEENKNILLKVSSLVSENKEIREEIGSLRGRNSRKVYKETSRHDNRDVVDRQPRGRDSHATLEEDAVDGSRIDVVQTAVVEATNSLESLLKSVDSWVESTQTLRDRVTILEQMAVEAAGKQEGDRWQTNERLTFMDAKIEFLAETSNKLSAESQVMQRRLKKVVKNEEDSRSKSTENSGYRHTCFHLVIGLLLGFDLILFFTCRDHFQLIMDPFSRKRTEHPAQQYRHKKQPDATKLQIIPNVMSQRHVQRSPTKDGHKLDGYFID